jgi:hypothetical protein
MPVVKFDTPDAHAGNKASCTAFVSYLEKEDKWKGIGKEFFFNHLYDAYSDSEVLKGIDCNVKGLHNNDAKFYTGSISFSEKELDLILNKHDYIRKYTIEAIKLYAQNFNKGLSIKDINWYAKIETNRYYKGTDVEVKQGKAKQGDIKPGNNIHVHFIIGRKTLDGKHKISPQTNHINTSKGAVIGGFSRDVFKEECEALFDKMFNYDRPFEERYSFYKTRKNENDINNLDDKRDIEDKKINNEQYHTLSNEEKQKKIQKLVFHIQSELNKKNTSNYFDVEQLLNTEKSYGYDGSIYKSLLNLNLNIKKGYVPKITDWTAYIIRNAAFHNYSKFSNYKSDIKETMTIENISMSNSNNKVESIKDDQKWNIYSDLLRVTDDFPRKKEEDLDISRFLKKKKPKKKNGMTL